MHWTELVGVRSVLLGCAAAAVMLLPTAQVFATGTPNASRPDLTGVVKDEDGTPLADASVFIYTAGPKAGNGILCPSCYADCRKRAVTDLHGHFRIESLDGALLFRVLVVAKGHRPEFVGKVDPAAKSIDVTLNHANEALSARQQLKSRVIDTDSKPIPGAVVSIRGVSRGESHPVWW